MPYTKFWATILDEVMIEEVVAVQHESTGLGNMHQCHGRQKAATPGVQEHNLDSEVAGAESAQKPTTNDRDRTCSGL